jgi:hypothetical protein
MKHAILVIVTVVLPCIAGCGKPSGDTPTKPLPEAVAQASEQPTEKRSFQAQPQPGEVEDLLETLSALMAEWEKAPDPAIADEILEQFSQSLVHAGPPSIARNAKEYRLSPKVVQVLVSDYERFVKFPPARKPDCVRAWRIGDFVYVEGFTMEERSLLFHSGGPDGPVTKSEEWRNESACDYLLLLGEDDDTAIIVAKGTPMDCSTATGTSQGTTGLEKPSPLTVTLSAFEPQKISPFLNWRARR